MIPSLLQIMSARYIYSDFWSFYRYRSSCLFHLSCLSNEQKILFASILYLYLIFLTLLGILVSTSPCLYSLLNLHALIVCLSLFIVENILFPRIPTRFADTDPLTLLFLPLSCSSAFKQGTLLTGPCSRVLKRDYSRDFVLQEYYR